MRVPHILHNVVVMLYFTIRCKMMYSTHKMSRWLGVTRNIIGFHENKNNSGNFQRVLNFVIKEKEENPNNIHRLQQNTGCAQP